MIGTLPTPRDKSPRSTLTEVAKAAGVSVATVSRVMNGENKEVWKGTLDRAEKIRQIAKKMGYRPDWRARALRARETHSVGVIYSQHWPMMDDMSYGPMFRSIGQVLEPAGYHMMFVHVSQSTGVLPASILQAVDAAIFYHHVGGSEIEAARALRGPAVLVNCEPKLPYPLVTPDEAGGAKALAEHLLGLGHRRISFLDVWDLGAEFDHHSRRVRRDVIGETMRQAGCGDGFEHWHQPMSTPLPEVVARYRQMPTAKRPTAVVCSYGVQAISLMSEFVRQGVRVPADLSLATFDDHELMAHATVPMTTVAVPMEDVGRQAAAMLLGFLQKPSSKRTKRTVLPERLVVRQSTGPAPR